MSDTTAEAGRVESDGKLERYLVLIEQERQRRPSEAMLADEIRRLRNVLRFYAEPANWTPTFLFEVPKDQPNGGARSYAYPVAEVDRGTIAREALRGS